MEHMSNLVIHMLDAEKRFEDWFHTLSGTAQVVFFAAVFIGAIVLVGHFEKQDLVRTLVR